MKKIFYKLSFILALSSSLVMTSCEDFLEEENKTGGYTPEEMYKREDIVSGLLASTYPYLRTVFGKEGGIGLSEAGTDIWFAGAENKQTALSKYTGLTPDVTPSGSTDCALLDQYAEIFSVAISNCNNIIKYTNAADAADFTKKDQFLAEAYYIRALFHWLEVETFGGMQCVTEPSLDLNPHRDSPAVYYTSILSDLDNAIAKLSGSKVKSNGGRVTYYAAVAFKARMCLTRASSLKSGIHTDGADPKPFYEEAKKLADEVIGAGVFSLYSNYSDLWKFDNNDGAKNNECIWYVDYSTNYLDNQCPKSITKDKDGNYTSYHGTIIRTSAAAGNNLFIMFNPTWYTASAGNSLTNVVSASSNTCALTRTYANDYAKYAVGYRRYGPTPYLLDLYDDTKDARYADNFRTLYTLDATKNPTLTLKTYPNMKDTVIWMMRGVKTQAQVDRAKGRYVILDRNFFYNADGSPTVEGSSLFIALDKFRDNTVAVNITWSSRDFFVLRLAEMYLISAEAAMEMGDAASAQTRINELRAKRSISGQTYTLNTSEIAQIAAKDIAVILDERARELCGENIRWFDLKRTNTLYSRVKTYNPAAVGIQTYHINRPIPNTFMYTISNITAPNTPGGWWQNAGY